MRIPTVLIAGAMLLTACTSGTRVVYVPAPGPQASPTPAPAPPARVVAAPMPPVGVTIVRVDGHRLLMSTNQPAYLAVFEIVPNRGVTLIYPSAPRQRQLAVAGGSTWLNVLWRADRNIDDDDGDMRRERRLWTSTTHQVYAIASERPLRLTDGAFDDATLGVMLGTRAGRATNPYETMTALSRRFVPPGLDEDWGEDVYAMDVARPATVVYVARIYCPDGSITYVRDDMADRASCPWRGRGRGTGPANAPAPRPDSVVASSGRPVQRRMDPGPARVFRVPDNGNYGNTVTNSNGGSTGNTGTANNGGNSGNSGNSGNGGNGGNDDAEGRNGGNGNNNNNGQNTTNNGQNNGTKGQHNDNNGRNGNGQHTSNGQNNNNNGRNDNDGNRNGNNDDSQSENAHRNPGNGRGNQPSSDPTIRLQGQPDGPVAKPDQKADVKAEAKPKQEATGMRAVLERMKERAAADSAAKDKDAKDKDAKDKDAKAKP